MRGYTVTLTIFKGGTGKTTTTVHTAISLKAKGKKVLVVDLDQQAQATKYLGIDHETTPSIFEVFSGMRSVASAIRQTSWGIDILSSHPYMAAVESALEPGDEKKLSDIITPLKPMYDFILIDNPPGKAQLAFNGMTAGQLLLIVCSAQRMAADGIGDTVNHVQKVIWGKQGITDQEIKILFTMFQTSTNHSHAILEGARKIWRDNVLKIRIPHSIIFSRSYDEKRPVQHLEPKHAGAIAYDSLADWLIGYEKTAI
jgi:chromosome partitioning protein